jgi:hypothetical protein
MAYRQLLHMTQEHIYPIVKHIASDVNDVPPLFSPKAAALGGAIWV